MAKKCGTIKADILRDEDGNATAKLDMKDPATTSAVEKFKEGQCDVSAEVANVTRDIIPNVIGDATKNIIRDQQKAKLRQTLLPVESPGKMGGKSRRRRKRGGRKSKRRSGKKVRKSKKSKRRRGKKSKRRRRRK